MYELVIAKHVNLRNHSLSRLGLTYTEFFVF